MTVDNNKVVSWFKNHIGKLTYSMAGSRNGTDGTADCSGSVTQAIYEASGIKYDFLYSTVTLGSYLAKCGYQRIAVNQEWSAKLGDIVMMSWGSDMNSSGGAGGHVGVIADNNDTFISTDYSTNGQAGTAVSQWNIDTYLAKNAVPYFEVWRYSGSQPSPPSSGNNKEDADAAAIAYFKNTGGVFSLAKAFKIDEMRVHNGIAQYVNYDLAGWDSIPSEQWKKNGNSRGTSEMWTNNGIPFEVTFKPGYKFKVGDMINPDIYGTIDEYDAPSGGIGVNLFGLDGQDYGVVWFKADALLNRF